MDFQCYSCIWFMREDDEKSGQHDRFCTYDGITADELKMERCPCREETEGPDRTEREY